MAESNLQEQVTSLTEQVANLQEQINTVTSERDSLKTRAERAEDALLQRQATDAAREALADTDLPQRACQRVIEQTSAEPPTADDGSLDRDKLTERVTTAANEERAYLAEAVGAGRVSGMGSGQPNGQGPKTAEDYQALGLSEADAKAAARIHA